MGVVGFLAGMFYKRSIDNLIFKPKRSLIKIMRPSTSSGEGHRTSDGTWAHMVRDSSGKIQCIVIDDSTVNVEWVSFQ